jgi:hypothetical protein
VEVRGKIKKLNSHRKYVRKMGKNATKNYSLLIRKGGSPRNWELKISERF